MTATHETTGSAFIVSIGSAFLAFFNVDPTISQIAAVMSILASATIVISNVAHWKGSQEFRDAFDARLRQALPWLKGLAFAFISGGGGAAVSAIGDPQTFNFSTGLPSLWHVFLVCGGIGAVGYLKQSPFFIGFQQPPPQPAAPIDNHPPSDSGPASPAP